MPQTVVRFGAAHCDVRTVIRGERVVLPIRNDRDRLSLGAVLCELHGIKGDPLPLGKSPKVSTKERARRPSKNQPAPGIVGRKAIMVIHDDFEQRSPPPDFVVHTEAGPLEVHLAKPVVFLREGSSNVMTDPQPVTKPTRRRRPSGITNKV